MALSSPDASEPRYKSGDVIAGKYQLEALLGEGGMGVVWGAVNLQLEAPVAIKLLSQGGREERELLSQRLKQEAKAAAKLGHPAIVRVFDVGESELGDPFIVMERLRGRSLAAWLAADGRIAPILAVRLLLPIADALAAAHAKGIVHRDLKPDNVFIDESEQLSPKLVDFGIVKFTDPASGRTHLTQSGMVLGSPEYMSPEQARGREDIDARTDVWSFCVVLYEAVTGSTPFAAANSNALLVSIAMDDPRPLEPRTEAEAGLWQIILRGLAKEREQRFQSMGELGRALAGWLIEQGVHEDACGASLEAKWIVRSSDSPAARPLLASSPVIVVTPPGSAARIPSSELEIAATHEQPVVTVTPHSARSAFTADEVRGSRRARIGLALGGGVLLAVVGAFALGSPAHPFPVVTLRPAAPRERVESSPVKSLRAVEPRLAPSRTTEVGPAPAVSAQSLQSASPPAVLPPNVARAPSAASALPSKSGPRAARRSEALPKAAPPHEQASTDLLSPY